MFAYLVAFSLRHRLVVVAVACLLVLYGAFAARQLPVDVLPDMTKPIVTLVTEAGGLAPEEVEVLYDRLCAVAAIAGHAVDCEWVIDESGQAWIVQWRGVTALPDNDEPEWDPAEYAARYAFRSG